MEINKLYDDAYEIKNFLSKEELDAVNFIIQNTPEEAWFDEEAKKRNEIPDFWYGKHLRFNVDNIFTDKELKAILQAAREFPLKKVRVQKWGGQGVLDHIKISDNIIAKIQIQMLK